MKAGLRCVVASVLAMALLAAVAAAGVVEVAKARSPSGTSVLTRAGRAENVGSSTQFQDGDSLRVPTDGRLTVEFGDGSSLTLVGPATMRFGQMNSQGRRVVLASGAITEAVVRGIALEIQAPDPYDASFVLQNARGFARVKPGSEITFQKLEGVYAKAWHAGQSTDLGEGFWLLNVRDNTVSPGSAPRAPSGPAAPATEAPRGALREQLLPGDHIKIVINGHVIVYSPGRCFKRTESQNGDVTLCYTCNERRDDFGVVEIGLDTTLFLAEGECVTFDQYGNVSSFDGIAHIYHPLSDAVFYDEPVENAADASPSYSKFR